MQHFGAPSRLLDWTKSLYAALYFAVVDSADTDGTVWIADGNALRSELDFSQRSLSAHFLAKEMQGKKTVAWYEIFAPFDRLVSQQGLFTLSTDIMMNHHAAIDDLHKKTALRKLIIPSDCKADFLDKLVSMNITAASMFPGLDGIGRSISETISLLLAQQMRSKK